MATFTLSFETNATPVSKITDAFASNYNYQSKLPDGSTNPETKAAFTKRMVRNYIIEIVKAEDLKTVRTNAEAGVSSINLT